MSSVVNQPTRMTRPDIVNAADFSLTHSKNPTRIPPHNRCKAEPENVMSTFQQYMLMAIIDD